jgi:hypothetical protein
MTMEWQRAADIKPESGSWYLVWSNGREWGDHHIHLWSAPMLKHHLGHEIVRGKPLWVAKIVDPIAFEESETPRLQESKVDS